jgi:hypothetical protein
MKSITALFAAILVLGTVEAAAQPYGPVILGPGLNAGRTLYVNAGSRVLSADTTYILTGLYTIDSTYSITIPAGTVIKGDTAACLVIRRGAQIIANGTRSRPIVFTSNKPAGTRAAGDWGGLVVLGKAPTNRQANPQIEGGIVPGFYGGAGPGLGDPNDNSGTIRYVRIEYPGYRFALNNEVNGLTMGGVGAGTTIEYVQVSFSNDDGFEWFGGTVNAKYLVTVGAIDDDFDTDFGYQGKVQFAFGMKYNSIFEFSGGQTNGFETDNEGTASYVEPRTRPDFSNVTLVGPQRVDSVTNIPGNRHEFAACIRRGSQNSIYNSIFTGFRGGFTIRDNQTHNSANGDTLRLRNITLATRAELVDPLNTLGSPISYTPIPSGIPGFNASTWYQTGAYNNTGGASALAPSAAGLVNMNDLTNPDPRPTGSTPSVNTVDFSGRLANPFFQAVGYRGAFDPNVPMSQQWTAGWTNFDPQTYNADGTTAISVGTPWTMVSLPRTLTNATADGVFPTRDGAMFRFDPPAYSIVTNLDPGFGYWVRYTAPATVTVGGGHLNGFQYNATVGGFHLIGAVSESVPVSSITTTGAGTLSPTVFGWDPTTQAYIVGVPSLQPGQGYWVSVSDACTIYVTSPTAGARR